MVKPSNKQVGVLRKGGIIIGLLVAPLIAFPHSFIVLILRVDSGCVLIMVTLDPTAAFDAADHRPFYRLSLTVWVSKALTDLTERNLSVHLGKLPLNEVLVTCDVSPSGIHSCPPVICFVPDSCASFLSLFADDVRLYLNSQL